MGLIQVNLSHKIYRLLGDVEIHVSNVINALISAQTPRPHPGVGQVINSGY